jgi:cytochrome d ubiquinol oxidase subunit I
MLLAIAAAPPELLAARSQMAFTLGFHIVLACLGVGLPTIVLIANGIGLRRASGGGGDAAGPPLVPDHGP